MDLTVQDVLSFVESEDIAFIRLAFCDAAGTHKNIAVMPPELAAAFDKGLLFQTTGLHLFSEGEEVPETLRLLPDPGTLTAMPWRPQHGKVVHLFCHLLLENGAPFAGDQRRILEEASKDRTLLADAEQPFTLYQLDEAGYPTKLPLDEGGYLDVAPLDKGENIRRTICLNLEQMGIQPTRSHHAAGSGKNLVKYAAADPVTAADHLVLFRDLVRTAAGQNGLYAEFDPVTIGLYEAKESENRAASLDANEVKMGLSFSGFQVFNQLTSNDTNPYRLLGEMIYDI